VHSRIGTYGLTRVFLFCLVVIFPVFASPQTQINTFVDTTRGYIGDLFHLQLEVSHPEGAEVIYPADTSALGEFTVRSASAEPQNNATLITYQLAVYDTGKYVVPPVPVRVARGNASAEMTSLESAPVEITILSMVPPDARELKDIKPLMSLPSTIPWLWIGLGLSLIAAAVGIWLYLRKRGAVEEPEISPRERRRLAHEWAHERLRQIEQRDYPAHGAMKQHFTEVSQTVRDYFENRYFFPALEMTSREVLDTLSEYDLGDEAEEQTAALLTRADLVKFAKYRPSPDEAYSSLQTAFHIVETTKIVDLAPADHEDDFHRNEGKEETSIQANKGEEP